MSSGKNIFSNLSDYNQSIVTIADNAKLEVQGTGDVNLEVSNDGNMDTITAKNVLYVPGISNLLFVSQMTRKNLTITFTKDNCKIFDKDMNQIATASLDNDIYRLDQEQTKACSAKIEKNNEL